MKALILIVGLAVVACLVYGLKLSEEAVDEALLSPEDEEWLEKAVRSLGDSYESPNHN